LQHAAAPPTCGRDPRTAPAPALAIAAARDWLARQGPRAWRQRRPALAVAWTVCLVGWTGVLLQPQDHGHAAGAGARARAGAGPAPELEHSRERIAALAADLEAARRMRAVQADGLAETPRLLGDRVNPIHERAASQLAQQAALIAALHARLATARTRGDEIGRALAAEAGQPAVAPSGRRASRRGLLCLVLILGLAAAAISACWRARRDGIVDHPAQLRHRPGLPLLGTIAVPMPPERQRQAHRGRLGLAIAWLALLGLLGGVVAAEAVAPPVWALR
jgi:hypothetical protein